MSNWTHIAGCLYIETFTKRKNIKRYIEKILEKAPKITGSENDLDIFVNPLSGYNVSSWKEDKNGDFIEYQTCVGITLIGDLRDRDLEQSKKEILAFIQYIEKLDFQILYSSITIYEDYIGKKETIRIKDFYDYLEDKEND